MPDFLFRTTENRDGDPPSLFGLGTGTPLHKKGEKGLVLFLFFLFGMATRIRMTGLQQIGRRGPGFFSAGRGSGVTFQLTISNYSFKFCFFLYVAT